MGSNRFDIVCLAVNFEPSNPSEASVDATLYIGGAIGITGTWVTDSTLVLRYFQLASSSHLAIEAELPPNLTTVMVQIRDETGYTPPDSFLGTEVETCPSGNHRGEALQNRELARLPTAPLSAS